MYKGPSSSRNRLKPTSKDLNLVPIMNLFITIIPMLLVITVTVKMAMVEIQMSVNSSGNENEEQKEDEDVIKTLKLAIFSDRFELIVEDEDSVVEKIPVTDPTATDVKQRYNFFELEKKLDKFRKENQEQEEITILAADNVDFGALMASVDVCKYKGFPSINYESAEVLILRKK